MPRKTLAMATLAQLLNEDFRRHNIIHLDYTPDVIEHLVRFHWHALLGMRSSGDLDAICTLADLLGAISKLTDEQQHVVRAMVVGYPTSTISATYKVHANKVSKQAFRDMSAILLGKVVVEDESM